MSEMNVRQPSSEEITRRLVRKEQASQERYLNLERLAQATERQNALLEDQARALWKIGDYLHRMLPAEEKDEVLLGTPEHVEVNDAGMPVPPWINEPSTETVEYDKG